MKHAAFHWGYIWAALALALFVGFAVGAHLSFILGFGFLPSPGFAGFIQVHGHIQLAGWAGLFIMGVGLHFLPRLAGAPLAWPRGLSWILWFMIVGLSLRALAQAALPYVTAHNWFGVVSVLAVASGVLEFLGTALYVGLLLHTLYRVGRRESRPALRAVRPYILTMLMGWSVYTCLNLVLLVAMAWQRRVVLPTTWHYIAIESFIGLVLLPVAFAFSIRLFPLYLRLSTSHDWSSRLVYAYLMSWLFQMLPMIVTSQQMASQGPLFVSQIGRSMKAGVVLWFVWRLRLFHQRRSVSKEKKEMASCQSLAVHKLFGPFERLIASAYIWLILAASSDMIAGIASLFGYDDMINVGAIRHLYVFGFITLLIFGVSVRMMPGFVGQKRVAKPGLVTATLWLGNAAVFCRILLAGVPTALWQVLPGVVPGAQVAFALSGLLGLVAVGCLSANLWCTAHQMREALSA